VGVEGACKMDLKLEIVVLTERPPGR